MEQTIDYQLIHLLTPEQAHTFGVVPWKEEANLLFMLCAEGEKAPEAELQLLLGKAIEIEYVDPNLFQGQLLRNYPLGQKQNKGSHEKLEADSDVIRLVDRAFEEAIDLGVSDIHVERYESFGRIRFRWEGRLIEKFDVPLDQYPAIVSRLKIMADLDIAEKRLPQDGRIQYSYADLKIDVRLSTVPGKHGEKVVMRLLNRSAELLKLNRLGMNTHQFQLFQTALRKPHGMILITGPTGSGKTTTLYACLNQLNQPDRNILTVEDPVEYNLEGINQVQVKSEIGLGFNQVLRAFLRQDPDVIMVGEIRDEETAEIAVRAALTGHLVFSTLHTNSAIETIHRLADMGVPPYLLGSSLQLIVAQRLLRLLCVDCREKSDQYYMGKSLWISTGCPACNFTGNRGRKAIYEMLPINPEIEQAISQQKNMEALLPPGFRRLQDAVVEHLLNGEISFLEAEPYLVSSDANAHPN